jgi:hypothetical protein
LLLAGTGTAQAALYNLQDTARPGLATTSDGLRWWEGGPAYVLASSGAVRLNFRALYTYPPGAVMRGDLDDAGWWHSVPCNASAWAFCSSDVGQIMPWLAPRMPELQETVTADGWNDLGCANSAGKVLVSLGVYDVSACDIFDEGLDLLYTPGMIYHRHNTLQTWKYWVLVTLAIVLVRFLSYNIQVHLSSHKPPSRNASNPTHKTGTLGAARQRQSKKKQWPALACSTGALIVVLLDGDSLFVTSADQVFFWSTVVYILIYLAMHLSTSSSISRRVGELQPQQQPPVYNVIVASLQLIACRFYAAAETPYNLVLMAILACRGWYVSLFLVLKIVLKSGKVLTQGHPQPP